VKVPLDGNKLLKEFKNNRRRRVRYESFVCDKVPISVRWNMRKCIRNLCCGSRFSMINDHSEIGANVFRR
jgi:hypothetical protein